METEPIHLLSQCSRMHLNFDSFHHSDVEIEILPNDS